MYLIILFSLFILSTSHTTDEIECLNKCGQVKTKDPNSTYNRIMDGAQATEQSQPWIVRIQFDITFGFPPQVVKSEACTGFIIDNSSVLSAAHCLFSDVHRDPKFPLCSAAALGNGFEVDDWMQIKKVDIRIYTNAYKWDGQTLPSHSTVHTVEKLDFGEGYNKSMRETIQSSDYVLITVTPEFNFSAGEIRKLCLPAPFTTTYNSPEAYIHAGGDSGSPMQLYKNGRMFAIGLFTNAYASAINRQSFPDTLIRTDTLCDFLQNKLGKPICINFLSPPDPKCQMVLSAMRQKSVIYSAHRRILDGKNVTNNTSNNYPLATLSLIHQLVRREPEKALKIYHGMGNMEMAKKAAQTACKLLQLKYGPINKTLFLKMFPKWRLLCETADSPN